MKLTETLAVVAFVVAAAGCQTPPTPDATADLFRTNPGGLDASPIGKAEFFNVEGGVNVAVKVQAGSGLAAGGHGLHIHTNGDCGPNGTTPAGAAGGHFDPSRTAQHPHHAGDLGNLIAASDGSADQSFLTANVTLDRGERGILDRGLIVHAIPDPGDATSPLGARSLCGIIRGG